MNILAKLSNKTKPDQEHSRHSSTADTVFHKNKSLSFSELKVGVEKAKHRSSEVFAELLQRCTVVLHYLRDCRGMETDLTSAYLIR